MSDKSDYRDTVCLPKTDFPMKAGLASKEPAILARWAETKLYDQIREARKGRTRFILHDGPPYANGDIHIGHARMNTIKDFIIRSQSLMGKEAPFIPGWDCHGLPIEWIRDNGADILRLWVASTDHFEDVRIGREILAGTSDAYRKLRNTFRYLLGALAGFGEAERTPVGEMPGLERWILHRLAELDRELRAAAEEFDLNRYTRAITVFANDDLSAFFFDVRKDSLHCDAPSSPKRRAYRTVLDTLFHALVRWISPILSFTAEEVWATRYPDKGSVHLLVWPEVDPAWRDEALARKWELIRATREPVTEAIEPLRREKVIGSSLEARILYPNLALDLADEALADLAEIYIVSEVTPEQGDRVEVTRTGHAKCGRCWRHLPEVKEEGGLCGRCDEVVNGRG